MIILKPSDILECTTPFEPAHPPVPIEGTSITYKFSEGRRGVEEFNWVTESLITCVFVCSRPKIEKIDERTYRFTVFEEHELGTLQSLLEDIRKFALIPPQTPLAR